MQLERAVCASLCVKRFRACATGTPEPGCNADYVGCIVTRCQTCISTFRACFADADATPQACQKPFIACLKPSLASLKSKPPITFAGGDGATLVQAVKIEGAQNEHEGIVSENLWAMNTHPGWRKADQALINQGGEAFDRIGYQASDGKHEAWFDITGFFGRM